MPPVVFDIRCAEDSRDVVHRAVQALAEREIVAFPTETVYGLAVTALDSQAVDRLIDVKQRPAGQPFVLAICNPDTALDYSPELGALGQRLARRCWPGPVTLVVDSSHRDSLVTRLPEAVRRAIAPNGTVGLRIPAHPTILDVLGLTAGPIVLTSANRRGQPESLTADDVVQQLGDDVAIVLDDGRCRFGQPSSVVRVNQHGFDVLRAGVVSEQTLKRLASMMILFVCTGNTCRSPMAEWLCRRMLAERLECRIDELEERGFVVNSAGIAALTGGRASREAVDVLAGIGLDLSQHESQPLTDRLVRHADSVLVMTKSHRDAIVAEWPDAAERTRLICHDNADVGDPIGGTRDQYVRCVEQIQDQLERWVESWKI